MLRALMGEVGNYEDTWAMEAEKWELEGRTERRCQRSNSHAREECLGRA